MRKNLFFGFACFMLVTCVGTMAFALNPSTEISMGTFSVPKPVNGVDGHDGCTPEVTVSEKSDGCYTTTTQKKKLENGSCVNDGGPISRETCDGSQGEQGQSGDNACYAIEDVSGFGTNSFALAIKWCCNSTATNCQEMTNSYPTNGAYDDYYQTWVTQNCAHVFTSTPIDNGYTITETNPCTGQVVNTYDIVNGLAGNDADIEGIVQEYIPYPQSKGTCSGTQCQFPNKPGYVKTTITYRPTVDRAAQIIEAPDTCSDALHKPTTNGAYVDIRVCKAQGNATNYPTSGNPYRTGDEYYFEIVTSDDYVSPADVANKVPLSAENRYKGPDIANSKPGYKYTLETYPDGTTMEKDKEYDEAVEVVEYTSNGTTVGKRYTCGGRDTNTVCLNVNVKYCFGLSAPTGTTCTNAPLVGDALDAINTISETLPASGYYYNGPNTSGGIEGYKYKTNVYLDGHTEETDRQPDHCEPVMGNPIGSIDPNEMFIGRKCYCGGITNDVPCNTANAWYLFDVQNNENLHDINDVWNAANGALTQEQADELYLSVDNQISVNIKAFGQTLYYCSGSATCCEENQTPGEGDFATCWTSVNIEGLQGKNGASCFATKNGTSWSMCCSPTWAGNDCTPITDSTVIAMLNGMLCHTNYSKLFLHTNPNGGEPIANNTADDAIGVRVTLTDSCDSSNTQSYDTYNGPQGEPGAPGANYSPCNGLESGTQAALNTVLNSTVVYVPHGNGSNGTTTGKGYYLETQVMCDPNGNVETYKYDECSLVADPRVARNAGYSCANNEALLKCTPWEGNPITPYFICSAAEVTGYPKTVYVSPQVSNNKLTEEGYTKWVHKFSASGSEIEETGDKDTCHNVYKQAVSTSGNTVTTTLQSVRKCQVQSPGNVNWTQNTWYCLDTNASGSCDGYSETITSNETSTLKYHLPALNGTTPTSPGYVYIEVSNGGTVTAGEMAIKFDDCVDVYKASETSTAVVSQTQKCTVRAPGYTGTNAAYLRYVTDGEYCLNVAGGNCTGFVEDINLSTAFNAAQTVANTESVYHEPYPAANPTLPGYVCTKVTYQDGHVDDCTTKVEDSFEVGLLRMSDGSAIRIKVYTVQTPGSINNTYYETGDEYCIGYANGQCPSGILGLGDMDPCSGVTSANLSTTAKKVINAYTAPTMVTGENYSLAPGYMTDTRIMCDGNAGTSYQTDDQCDEVPNDTVSTPQCPTGTPVLKLCKRPDGGSSYYVCLAGDSVYGAINDVTTAIGNLSGVDPCAAVANNPTAAAKTVKKSEYEYVANTTSAAGVGYGKKTQTMCDANSTTHTEYIYDTCMPESNVPQSCGNGKGKYYQCVNQTTADTTYYTCNPTAVGTIALSNIVANKLDNDVQFSTANGYITMTATGMSAPANVVALSALKGDTGASAVQVWAQQVSATMNNAKCQLVFSSGHRCDQLDASDFIEATTPYGYWKQDQVLNHNENNSTNLTVSKYFDSLKPCQNGFEITQDGTENGGNKYVMSCVD